MPASVAIAGFATTGAMAWYSLRKIEQGDDPRAVIPKASMFTAAFFVASWVNIPVPPVSVHLILNGLMGVILGWYAFPAILIGLFFQAVMFGHGGLTTLGVNATMMGVPAILAYYVFRLRGAPGLRSLGERGSRAITGVFAFLGGALGLGLAALILFTLLIGTVPSSLDGPTERAAITGLVLAHIPLAAVEGAFTALVVLFLLRVKPVLLEAPVTKDPGKAKLARSG